MIKNTFRGRLIRVRRELPYSGNSLRAQTRATLTAICSASPALGSFISNFIRADSTFSVPSRTLPNIISLGHFRTQAPDFVHLISFPCGNRTFRRAIHRSKAASHASRPSRHSRIFFRADAVLFHRCLSHARFSESVNRNGTGSEHH